MATLARRDGMSPCPELYPGGLKPLTVSISYSEKQVG